MSKVCCGITYSDKDRFCRVCGKRLEDEEEKTVLINEQQIRNAIEDDEPGTSVLTADMRGPIKHPENAEQAGNSKEDSPVDSKSEDVSVDGEDSKSEDSPADNDKEDNKNKNAEADDKDNKSEEKTAEGDSDEDDEDSTTSILTADMKKQAPQTQPNGVPKQPMPSQMPSMQPNGKPMQQMPPMQPNGRPMQQMPGQMPPMQQPAKPKKSEEQKEKTAKTCGLISLIVSGIGLVAVAVMLFLFVLNADYKKYDKEAEKGLYNSTPTTETASSGDSLSSEEE